MGTEKRERQKANKAAKQETQAEEKQVETRKSRFKLFGLWGVPILLVVAGYLILGGNDDEPTDENQILSYAIPAEGASLDPGWDCPAADGSSPRATAMLGDAPNCLDEGASYSAVITTSEGSVTVTLDPEGAPNATNTFVILARYGYYEETGVFSSNTGLGSVRAGAPHTQEDNEPGPGFSFVPDPDGNDFSAGAVVLYPNGTFDLVATNATPGYEDGQGTVVGQMTPDSAAVALQLFNLHEDNTSTVVDDTDGAPRTPVLIESIVINQA